MRTNLLLKVKEASNGKNLPAIGLMRTEDLIENWYKVQRFYIQVARELIVEQLKPKFELYAFDVLPINA